MTEPVTIGIGATKWVKDSNTKMMTLNMPSTTGTLSLHDDTGVDYQVPVGKKFIILKILTGGGWAAGYTPDSSREDQFVGRVYTNTTTDSTTGAVLVFQNNGGQNKHFKPNSTTAISATNSASDFEVYLEVAAGKYIVGNTTSYVSINVTGVETDV
jgi:hypothetical protein